MAEETKVEETTEQESPSVEESPTDSEVEETAEKPDKTPETEDQGSAGDKNWKAVREELEALKAENKKLKGDPKPLVEEVKKSEVTKPFLTDQDLMYLNFEEYKAQQQYPELDSGGETYNKLFDTAVAGQYRAELDEYARGLVSGNRRPLPSATQIAKQMKKEWEDVLGKTSAKVKTEVAQQAQKAIAAKEATLEVESRSVPKTTSSEELEKLKTKSRQGDIKAVVERLTLSKL